RDPETFEPPEHYSLSNTFHGVKVKVQVMQRVKGRRGHFPGLKKVPQICARMRAARVAGARDVDRPVVLCVAGVPDVQTTLGGKQLSVAGVAGRQDAVEQIDAPRD